MVYYSGSTAKIGTADKDFIRKKNNGVAIKDRKTLFVTYNKAQGEDNPITKGATR